MNTTLQIRIDRGDKIQAQKILKKVGLDLSSGVKAFIKQVTIDKGMPFRPRTENGFTPEYEALLLKESAWAKKHAKRYNSVKEMMTDLRK